MLEIPLECDNCGARMGYVVVETMDRFLNLKVLCCNKCKKNIMPEIPITPHSKGKGESS